MTIDPLLCFGTANLSPDERNVLERILPADFGSITTEKQSALLDALFFVYTAENAGLAISKGDAFAHACLGACLEDLSAGKLIEWRGDGGASCLCTTLRGEILGSYLAVARIDSAIADDAFAKVHALVPILLAGRRERGHLRRTFPASFDNIDQVCDLPAFMPPDVFKRFEEFCRSCLDRGCAILYTDPADKRKSYVFPPEFSMLLVRLLELLEEHDYAVWSERASLVERAMEFVCSPSKGKEWWIGGVIADVTLESLEGEEMPGPQGDGDVIFPADAAALESSKKRLMEQIRGWLLDAFSSSDGGAISADAGGGGLGNTDMDDAEAFAKPYERTSHTGISPGRTKSRTMEGFADPLSQGGLRIFLGYSDTGEEVCWEPTLHNNGHFVVIGGSGAGKTETLRVIATELERQYYPTLLIDFHGDMLPKGSRAMTYRIREGSEFYFNPLELDPLFPDITPLRATSDFLDALSINFPTLGIQQRRRIKEIVRRAYREHGITPEPETWCREIPFEAIEEGIMASEDESLIAYLEDIFDYSLFSGTTRLSAREILHRGTTHIQLSALPETLRYLFADLLLRRLFYSLQAMGEIPRDRGDARSRFRLFVIVDEAKLLLIQRPGHKQVIRAVLNRYATEMRKFGVGLILASQLISHFNDEILANVAVKLCMKTENRKEAMENSRYFEIDASDLMNFATGEGILVGGGVKTRLKILPLSMRRRES